MKNPRATAAALLVLAVQGATVAAQQAGVANQMRVPPQEKLGAYDLSRPTHWTPNETEWVAVPVFPPGAQMQIINGDPALGPSDMLIRFPAGYAVPWHWHTPNETVYLQSGTLVMETRETGDKTALGPGSYFLAPSRSVHRASCTSGEECRLFMHSDDKFDINIVDERGKVIQSGP